jgi:hypothetical protein
LVNVNVLKANFPGVDLYDPTSALDVQATSETAPAMITKAIETLAGGTLSRCRGL